MAAAAAAPPGVEEMRSDSATRERGGRRGAFNKRDGFLPGNER